MSSGKLLSQDVSVALIEPGKKTKRPACHGSSTLPKVIAVMYRVLDLTNRRPTSFSEALGRIIMNQNRIMMLSFSDKHMYILVYIFPCF